MGYVVFYIRSDNKVIVCRGGASKKMVKNVKQKSQIKEILMKVQSGQK